jgi:hypothetical protein
VPNIKGEITLTNNFEAMVEAAQVRLELALVEWAEATKTAIVARETRVGDAAGDRNVFPGKHLRDSFEVGRVRRGPRGLYIRVFSRDPNALWQEKGTLGRRRAKLKSRPSDARRRGKGTGVKPLYFMAHGVRDAFPAGLERVRAALFH